MQAFVLVICLRLSKWKCVIRPFDFCQCMPAAMQARGINIRALCFAYVAQVEIVVQRDFCSSTGALCALGCSCSACGTQEVLCSNVLFPILTTVLWNSDAIHCLHMKGLVKATPANHPRWPLHFVCAGLVCSSHMCFVEAAANALHECIEP